MRIWPYLVAMGVLAYTVGTLFQRAGVTGIALFRMFGTIGIVILGILAGIVHARLQSEGARAELGVRLRRLRGVDMQEVPQAWRRGALRTEAILSAVDGTQYVVGASLAPNFRSERHIRRVQREAAQLRRRVDELRQARADRGEGGRVVGLLILLRRKVGAREDAAAAVHGIVAANVEQLHPDLLLPGDGSSATRSKPPTHPGAQGTTGEGGDASAIVRRRNGEGHDVT